MGVMVLLMVLTVGFAPIALPLVLEGATVAPGDIASSLVVYMLVPLSLGLMVRARYSGLAARVSGGFKAASTTGLIIAIVAGLLVTWRDVLGSIGSWLFAGTALVLVSGFAAGWLVGLGRGTSERTVLGLATAQRNVSAALVVAASLGPDAMVRTLVAALFIPLALIVVAGEVGRRSDSSATSDQPAEGTTA